MFISDYIEREAHGGTVKEPGVFYLLIWVAGILKSVLFLSFKQRTIILYIYVIICISPLKLIKYSTELRMVMSLLKKSWLNRYKNLFLALLK